MTDLPKFVEVHEEGPRDGLQIEKTFVPTETMPGPVRWFAENQPVTSIVDTLQNLFAGQPVGSDIWIALAWCVGILVLAYVWSMAVYRRKIS